jgi:thiamine monophosphate synthase
MTDFGLYLVLTRPVAGHDACAEAAVEEGVRFVQLRMKDEPREEARRAAAQSPTYIGVGPIFPTPTKRIPDPVLGVERAARIAASTPLPAVGIGGIDATNLPAVLAAGIRNFAVVRHVCGSDRPRDAIRELLAIRRECGRRDG